MALPEYLGTVTRDPLGPSLGLRHAGGAPKRPIGRSADHNLGHLHHVTAKAQDDQKAQGLGHPAS
jgi:hypothetical protein